MKLIDLIELLFKPAHVQFEPVPWRGPMPERWCVSAGMAYKVPTDWRAVYSDGWAEIVSAARVVEPRPQAVFGELLELTVNGELLEPFVWPLRP